LSQKIAGWVGFQGQVTSAKKARKPAPSMMSPTKKTYPNHNKFFNLNLKTSQILRWFEQLSSSIAWRIMVFQRFAKKVSPTGRQGLGSR